MCIAFDIYLNGLCAAVCVRTQAYPAYFGCFHVKTDDYLVFESGSMYICILCMDLHGSCWVEAKKGIQW